MPARLKLFVTRIGFREIAVATTSRAKALAAWDVRQDLFKEGLAQEAGEDHSAWRAAIREPGRVFMCAPSTKNKWRAIGDPPARPEPPDIHERLFATMEKQRVSKASSKRKAF